MNYPLNSLLGTNLEIAATVTVSVDAATLWFFVSSAPTKLNPCVVSVSCYPGALSLNIAISTQSLLFRIYLRTIMRKDPQQDTPARSRHAPLDEAYRVPSAPLIRTG